MVHILNVLEKHVLRVGNKLSGENHVKNISLLPCTEPPQKETLYITGEENTDKFWPGNYDVVLDLKEDGSVLTIGDEENTTGQCNRVTDWRDSASVSVGLYRYVVLNEKSTVLLSRTTSRFWILRSASAWHPLLRRNCTIIRLQYSQKLRFAFGFSRSFRSSSSLYVSLIVFKDVTGIEPFRVQQTSCLGAPPRQLVCSYAYCVIDTSTTANDRYYCSTLK